MGRVRGYPKCSVKFKRIESKRRWAYVERNITNQSEALASTATREKYRKWKCRQEIITMALCLKSGDAAKAASDEIAG